MTVNAIDRLILDSTVEFFMVLNPKHRHVKATIMVREPTQECIVLNTIVRHSLAEFDTIRLMIPPSKLIIVKTIATRPEMKYHRKIMISRCSTI